ncbi:hypothetical protein CHS0354_031872 [Potamilus streckersoni]|uniref:PKD/REJ-like domain-containing protein n=1 Tax=Potamilus streckersoni TaxID=2493646 RepID=A0AAE0RY83_9BIVA|nr:hypothetical protein CHS0354_031872 [Potamilus streckersoni]
MDGKISCNIDVPMVSARGTIFASLNKQDLIGLGHQITYYAKSPVVVSQAFDGSGQFIILTFDTDVDTRGLDTCNKILSDVSKLGTNTKCTWISGKQLKIVLPSDATVLTGDTLSLMKGIRAARQVYGKEASTGPNPVSLPMTVPPPVISIEGPEEVGSCQTKVSYMVSISKGLGSRPFKSIVWSLNKDGVRYDSAFNVMEFSTQLTELGVYEVNITVTNFLTIASTTAINVTKTNQTKPIAILDTDLEKSTEGLPIIRLNKGSCICQYFFEPELSLNTDQKWATPICHDVVQGGVYESKGIISWLQYRADGDGWDT